LDLSGLWNPSGLVNAASNLLADGLAAISALRRGPTGCEACGEEGSGSSRKNRVKPASMKQEVRFEPVLVEMSKFEGMVERAFDVACKDEGSGV